MKPWQIAVLVWLSLSVVLTLYWVISAAHDLSALKHSGDVYLGVMNDITSSPPSQWSLQDILFLSSSLFWLPLLFIRRSR